MAVIGRRGLLVLFACAAVRGRADQAGDVRSQLEVVATALSAGNPANAMSPFDKSYANYDKLSGYFDGLTSAFRIVNEIDVVDEEDSAPETKVTVHWTITLTDLGMNYTVRRECDINARLVPERGKWKIVDFGPIWVFDPQQPSK